MILPTKRKFHIIVKANLIPKWKKILFLRINFWNTLTQITDAIHYKSQTYSNQPFHMPYIFLVFVILVEFIMFKKHLKWWVSLGKCNNFKTQDLLTYTDRSLYILNGSKRLNICHCEWDERLWCIDIHCSVYSLRMEQHFH